MIRKTLQCFFLLTLLSSVGCATHFEDLGVVTLLDGSQVQGVRFLQERFAGHDATNVQFFHFDHKTRTGVVLEPVSVAGPGIGKFMAAPVGYAVGQALRRPDEVDIRQSNSQNGGGATAYGGDSEAHGGNPVANGGQATANGGQSTAYGGQGGSSNSESRSSSNAENHPKVNAHNNERPKRHLSDYYPNR